MADVNYEYRDILIDKGKIVKISKNINVEDYPDAQVIKAVGRYVTPESSTLIAMWESWKKSSKKATIPTK